MNKAIVNRAISFVKNRLKGVPRGNNHPVELDAEDRRVLEFVMGNHFSMCSYNNLVTTIMACKYVLEQGIEGDFVECGVWRGGHSILAASVFERAKTARRVYLFDTFAGMSEPTQEDNRTADGTSAHHKYLATKKETHTDWCYASLDEVKANFKKAGVGNSNAVFIKGQVEQTLMNKALLNELESRRISVLRLDTDWYESTKLELQLLWPLLSSRGILVVDDYGYWTGSKKAVDEILASSRPFFNFIDEGARVAVKL